MNKIGQYLREKLIVVYMIFLGLLIMASAMLTFYNKQELVRTAQIKIEAEQVKYLLQGIFERTLRSMDLGIRGYALTQNEQMLNPYNNAVRDHYINLNKIDSLLLLQKLDTSVEKFAKIKIQLNNYLDISAKMKEEITNGNHEEFMRLLNMDKGYDAWLAFSPFYSAMNQYEDKVINQAEEDYQNAMNRNLVVQAILLIAGVSILMVIFRRLRKQSRLRQEIFSTLQQNSLQFLFHPGNVEERTDQSSIIKETIVHFKKASTFISSISNGDYNIHWEGLNETNRELNKQTLAGHLHNMREKLITYRQDEEKRNWTNSGITQYSEVVRKYQNNTDSLCLESVRFIVKYLNSQQGGLFVLTVEGDEKSLTLAAAVAFEKKKYIEKKINIGDGLVGQAYLEGETIKLKEIPEGYTRITSGLGHATPSCLAIVPMKHNEQVIAILELASFEEFTTEQIQFIERCGEFLAAALFNSQTNDQIKKLLEDTQVQAESMRSQEEEMRQNMEELSATQEEMSRKEGEYISKIEQLERQLKKFA